jgi:hypothetical protein
MSGTKKTANRWNANVVNVKKQGIRSSAVALPLNPDVYYNAAARLVQPKNEEINGKNRGF